MATMFVRHTVEDFDRWRRGYDDADARALRAELGVREAGIYRGADDPADVTVYHVYDSVEEARAFASDPRLRAKMEAIGVIGEPTVWITREVVREG